MNGTQFLFSIQSLRLKTVLILIKMSAFTLANNKNILKLTTNLRYFPHFIYHCLRLA